MSTAQYCGILATVLIAADMSKRVRWPFAVLFSVLALYEVFKP